MNKSIYQDIIGSGGNKIALLIDPDRTTGAQLADVCRSAQSLNIDLILVGGSVLWNDISSTIEAIKRYCTIPVVIFPGSTQQVSPLADGILFLSLISGRNPEFLIGQHIVSAPVIKQTKLEIIPTGYILIDGGTPTSVEYMSNTRPIPRNKPEIAVATALAGQMLGLKMLYLEGGSGAENSVPTGLISDVKANVEIPVVVGGGIRTPRQMRMAFEAGAKVVVIGTIIEEQPQMLAQFAQARD